MPSSDRWKKFHPLMIQGAEGVYVHTLRSKEPIKIQYCFDELKSQANHDKEQSLKEIKRQSSNHARTDMNEN